MALSHEIYFLIGRPFAPLYSLLMSFRAFLYKQKIFRRYRLPVPVISVGNLTMGGTGKTPMVMLLARYLADNDFRPAVISRGYGGKAADDVNVVSDGRTVLMSAEMAGDEPRFLAENLPGIPVLTGRKRVTAGKTATQSFDVDCVVLDDGFQHMSLERDLDLVLFNGRFLIGTGRVFPGGTLRESFSALERADAFVISGVSEGEKREATDFADLLKNRFPRKPLFFVPYAVKSIWLLNGEQKYSDISELPGPVYAFCGLAHPDSFQETLCTSGIALAGFSAFADHHTYTVDDLHRLRSEAKKAGACALLTTEKDAVKLTPQLCDGIKVFVLQAELQAPEEFGRLIMERLAAFNKP